MRLNKRARMSTLVSLVLALSFFTCLFVLAENITEDNSSLIENISFNLTGLNITDLNITNSTLLENQTILDNQTTIEETNSNDNSTDLPINETEVNKTESSEENESVLNQTEEINQTEEQNETELIVESQTINESIGETNQTEEINITEEINSTVEISLKLKDSKNRELKYQFNIIHNTDKKIKQKKQQVGSQQLEAGTYELEVLPEDNPIKKIKFKDLALAGDVNLGIDDVEEFGDYVEVYAIDPTQLNFTEATVTVIATGTSLYKCKEWDFENQQCLGEWQLFKSNLVPGEEYTFTLTPDDPGFAEVNGTGSFFEGFESNNLATNSWTTSGAGAAWTTTQWEGGGAYAGTYSAYVENTVGESILENSINATGYENIVFSFYAITGGMDPGEYFAADWYNGTAWINVLPQTQTISSYTLYSYNLTTAANNNANLKIRFRCSSGANNEDCNVDNVNVSGINSTDGTPPIVSLGNPANNSWSNSSSQTFYYTPSDARSNIANCSLIIDGTVNQTNSTITKSAENNFNLPLADGIYTWSVNCTDTSNNTGASESRTVNVDTTFPTINLNSPADAYVTTSTSVNFNFTVSDNLDTTPNCSLYFNSSLQATNSSVTNGTATLFSRTGITDGIYAWNISCLDDANNLNWSATRTFEINISPFLTSVSPSLAIIGAGAEQALNPTGVADPNNDNLKYYCSENSTPTAANTICDQGDATPFVNPYSTMNCTFDVASTDGEHTVYCRVYDGTYYSGVVNTSYTIDSSPPSISSTVTVAGTTAALPYTFYDTADDDQTNITIYGEAGMSCKYSLTDKSYAVADFSCTTSGSNATCSHTTDTEGLDVYNFYISCADSLGNGQNSTQNTDIISFITDWTAPTTSDSFTAGVKLPGYNLTLTETDNLDSDPLTYYCTDAVDCTPTTSIDDGGKLTFSTRGTNYLRYYSVDDAGNSQTIQNVTININQLPIFTSAADDATNIAGGSIVTISTVSSDADGQTLSLYICNSTDISAAGCGGSTYCSNITATANASCTFTAETDSTDHTWYAYLYDTLNESATSSYSGSYTTDSAAPTIIIIDPDNTTYTSSNVSVAITLDSAGNWTGYCLDSCSSNTSLNRITSTYWTGLLTNLGDGAHSIIFYVNDSSSNVGNSSTVYFTVDTSVPDTTVPAITILSPTQGTYYTSTSVLFNITLDEAGDWAGYSVDGNALQDLDNLSATAWNATLTLNQSIHNITFYANDSSGNLGNTSDNLITFYVDASAPVISATSYSPASPNNTANVTCTANLTDNLGLSYAIIEHNESGTAQNSSQISLSGTSDTASLEVDPSAGSFYCKFFVYDNAGLTVTNTTTITVVDTLRPNITSITYTPNTTAQLDPNVLVNVTATITDETALDTAVLQYRILTDANWTSTTMSNTSTTYNASFTPSSAGTWQFRINATDISGNENISSITNLTVALDSTWTNITTVPDTKSIVRTGTGVIQLGNLTINNTGDFTLNFTLNSTASWITFNSSNQTSATLSLSSGSTLTINVTANTTNFPVGEYNYNLTVQATNTSGAVADPSSSTLSKKVVIQNVAGPYLAISITTYDAAVDAGDTDISLIATVENVGTADASGTYLSWSLPSDWTVTAGTLNRSIGSLPVGTTATNSLTVSAGSSTGTKTISSSSNCSESSCLLTSDSKTVTVGTATTPTTTVVSSSSGGGGGGGSIVNRGGPVYLDKTKELINTSEEIEIVRGEHSTFNVSIKNIFLDTVLNNVDLRIEGYLSQYLQISPDLLTDIAYGEAKEFVVQISSPNYLEEDSYILNLIITGTLNGKEQKELIENRKIKLIIQEIGNEEAKQLLDVAALAIQKLSERTTVTKLEAMLKEAQDAYQNREFSKLKDICNEILVQSGYADQAAELIAQLNPTKPLLGSKTLRAVTGSFIAAPKYFQNTEDLLNLARAALERGDFETALKRAKEAQLAFELESRNDLGLLKSLLHNWYVLLFLMMIVLLGGYLGYRNYTQTILSSSILSLDNEERNIFGLLKESQQKYFRKKAISFEEYNQISAQYKKRIAEIRKNRINLRNKRLRLLKPEMIMMDLDRENKEYLSAIKKLQKDYFERRKISEEEYIEQLQAYSEAIAEIEDERLTLETESKLKEYKK
ncbi:MAG: hypothetical protein ABIA37_01730 [Candidatus Woesearchaeota archaeon]